MEIRTDRLLLRRVRFGDVRRVLALRSRPDVVRWLAGAPPVLTDEDQAWLTVARWIAEPGDPPLGWWAVVPTASGESGELVGVIGLGRPDPGGPLEAGWQLHPDVWGRGYATEAAAGLLGACDDAGIEEVHAWTHPDNDASARVCVRLGFAERSTRGTWRQWVRRCSHQAASTPPTAPPR